MRYRSHVLHELLKGFVLRYVFVYFSFLTLFCYFLLIIVFKFFFFNIRRGHEILHSFLPPKFEHVILLRFSHAQRTLYNLNVTFEGTGYTSCNVGPLKAFAVCSKVRRCIYTCVYMCTSYCIHVCSIECLKWSHLLTSVSLCPKIYM